MLLYNKIALQLSMNTLFFRVTFLFDIIIFSGIPSASCNARTAPALSESLCIRALFLSDMFEWFYIS